MLEPAADVGLRHQTDGLCQGPVSSSPVRACQVGYDYVVGGAKGKDRVLVGFEPGQEQAAEAKFVSESQSDAFLTLRVERVEFADGTAWVAKK